MDKRQVAQTLQKQNTMRFANRYVRFILYGIFGITISILLIFSALTLYLYQNPHALSSRIAQELKNRANIDISFSTVNVALFPTPALALTDVVLKYENIKLEVAYATASPSIIALIQGKFALGHANLLRPQISGKIESKKEHDTIITVEKIKNPDALLDKLQKFSLDVPIPSILHGSDISIMHGKLYLEHGNTMFIVDDAHTNIDISFGGSLDADLTLGLSRIFENTILLLKVDALDLSMSGLTSAYKANSIELNLSTRLQMANTLQNANIKLDISLHPKLQYLNQGDIPYVEHIVTGSWNIDGQLLWHDVPIPFVNNGEIGGNVASSFELNNMHVQLGDDKLNLYANIDNMLSDDPKLTGSIKLQSINLTRWFGFARNFPPGLQNTLQGIKDGELDFLIDKKGLYVTHVEASALSSRFQGTGGVSSWDNMIIKLDLKGKNLSLVEAFPESEGLPAYAPIFEHPPLTPIPGTPEAALMTGPSIGYDININVEKLTTWNLSVENVDFKCIPTEQDEKSNPKNHPNAVLLDFKIGKFYKGNGKAKVILFRSDEKKSGYDITAILRNVHSQDPLTILAGREIFGGRLALDTSFVAYGKNLGEFLISKVGELTLGVEDGFFTSKSKKRTTFNKFNVAGKFSSKPLTTKMINNMPEILRYNGIWRAEMDRDDLHFEQNLTGIITLVGRNYTDLVFDKTPGSLQATLTTGLIGLKQDILADISGNYSFDSINSTFSVAEANAIVPNFANTTFTGNLNLDYSNEIQWDASFDAETKQFSVLAEKLSADTKSPVAQSAPQNLKIKADISNKNHNLIIKNLSLNLGKMNVSGNLFKHSTTPKPSWDVDLKINLLDLDRIFPSKDVAISKGAENASTPPQPVMKTPEAKPWSLAWLRENNLKGHVFIDILRFQKTTSSGMSIPLNIQDGIINLKPITATFYNGKLEIDFVGKAIGDVLHVQNVLYADNINMLALSHELELNTVIGGTGTVDLSLEGQLYNPNKILEQLSGPWSANVVYSFLQTREKDGLLSGEKTFIDELHDSGMLANGILYSKNLILKGPDLSLTGNGHINLINDTLDMQLLVSTSGFNDIPVRYHGSLDNPERDIHAGSILLGAISTLGTGIFDILGGALLGIFGLFN